MTTKNLEFDFDLQMFALSTNPVISAHSSSIEAGTGYDAATSSSTDTTVVGTETLTTTTVTNTYTYYAFSDSVNSAAVQVNASTTSASSTTTVASPSSDIVTIPTFTNTSLSSPVTITGGGGAGSGGIVLNNIGEIADLSNNANIVVAATGSNLNLTGVGGNPVVITPTSGALNQTINNANIKATVSTGDISINGGEMAAPTLTAKSGSVNLGTIDNVQTWVVGNTNDVTYKNVNIATNSSTDTVLVSGVDSAGSYLAVTAGDDVVVKAVLASGSGDTLNFNGRTLYNVAKGNTELSENESIVTAVVANAGTGIAAGTGSVGGMATVGANAVVGITGTSTDAAIASVSNLATSNGRWVLGSHQTTAILGSDTVSFSAAAATNSIVADTSAGTQVATIGAFSAGTVTLAGAGTHSSIYVGGGSANWGYTTTSTTDTVVAVFDTVGSMTLGSETSAVVTLNSSAAKTLAVGLNDSLTLGGKAGATVAGGLVTNVASLASGGEWSVKGGTGERTVALGTLTSADSFSFAKADSSNNLYGVITANAKGDKAAAIDNLAGNVTVDGSASISGLRVVDNTWTVANATSDVVVFDSLGASATLTPVNSDLTVTATSNATVAVTGQSSNIAGKFNGVTVVANDSDSLIGVQLEGGSDTVAANLAGITSLNSGATINGDNAFTVNDTYLVQNIKGNNTKVSVASGSSAVTLQGVNNGDAFSVSGGNAVYDITSGASVAAVTVNGAPVTINAATPSLTNAFIYGTANSSTTDAVATIRGVKLNDTINTSVDSNFTVIYDSLSSSLSSDTSIKANNVSIMLGAGNVAASVPVTLSVSNSTGSMPHVTLNGGIANNSVITVGTGVYNVGTSAAVTINESKGYLTLDPNGNVTAEDESVADIRKYRDESLQTLASAQDTLGNATVNAFATFYDIYNTGLPDTIGTVAGFPTVSMAAAEVSSIAATSGANIYGDRGLKDNPEQITLQSFVGNSINIKKIEGIDSAHTVRTALVDARGGSASVIAVGMDQSQDKFATNHTIYGSSRASTIMVGPQATGNNVVVAGSVGSYLYHNAGGQGGIASIFGGAGNDTIIAEKGDHVEGGGGADYFYDTQAYEISDYSPESGDIIVATKLSSAASAQFTPDNLVISGNTVAIAGGSTITIGSNYDEATAVRAAIANAQAGDRKYLIWAGTYESVLDVSTLPMGMMMISSQNGSAADNLIGSAYADSIYAGANDTVNSGAGNDNIYLGSVDSDSGQRGATVALSAGKNNVVNWKGGFANDEGANILLADAATTSIKTATNGVVTATNGDSVMSFSSLEADSTGAYNFLFGEDKVTFIGNGQVATVSSNDGLASYYKADRAGAIVVTSDVTTAFTANLSSSYFTNITSVELDNNSRATVIGSSASERIIVSGSKESGAHKTVASGGGNDLIVSGGINSANASLVAGNHFYFGVGNLNYSSGRDTIQGYNYYTGKDSDPDGSGADVLHLGSVANFSGVSVMSGRLEVSLGDTATVVISDTFTGNSDKVVRATFDDEDYVYNVKFGVGGSSNNTFTYDGETNFYWGNAGRSRDTLNVASNLSNVNIWLDNRERDSVKYKGIGVINASALVDTKASLVGNYSNSDPYGSSASNTIIGGGSGSQSSLWGGGGESNSLVGGEGYDEFFYINHYGYTDSDGNRHGSNDVITNVTSEDLIRLYDVTLDDIDLENTDITGTAITVALKDQNGVKGGSITVTNFSQETNFRLADGSTYKAVVRGGNVGWE